MNKLVAFGALVLSCCTLVSVNAAPTKHDNIAEILALLQQHVYTSSQLNWDSIEKEAYAVLGNPATDESERAAIKGILAATKTNHTFYRYADTRNVIFHSDLSCRYQAAETPTKNVELGYLVVDRFSRPSRAEAEHYIAQIAEQLQTHDSRPLKGWIIDLRSNSGGNMWPMLAALSPILGNKRLGYFVQPDGTKIQWGTYNNFSVLDNRYQYRFPSQYALRNNDVPVAVLVSNKTASSGEAVLIATRALSYVRTFGQNSCGQSTANKAYKLANGDSLLITQSVMADFNGQLFEHGLDVDEVTDDAFVAASNWIESYNANINELN